MIAPKNLFFLTNFLELNMISDFFKTNNYFIDKKDNFQESYHIYNDKRERIGRIKQKLTGLQKLARFTARQAVFPFCVEIRSANGGLEASIIRKGNFLKSEITVQDATGKKVGIIDRKSNFFKPVFKILNTSNEVIAVISDITKKSNIMINDSSENQIGTIVQKWGDTMKSTSRSVKSYNVNIMENHSDNEEKVAILTSAIVINMFH